MLYHISYDLRKPGKNYDGLYTEIKSLGNWCHPVESTWYVQTSLGATAVRDKLWSVMDASDGLVVSTASAPGAWAGLDDDASSWLKNNL